MGSSTSSFDVAVIGGGVIGLAIGWRVAQRGMRTIVLERDQPGRGTSSVAAGMIAPVSEATIAEQELLRLSLASADLYSSFAAELGRCSGLDPGLLRCQTMLVARDGDEAEALVREHEVRARLGLEVRRLRASEARALEPALAPTVRLALEVSTDHAIDPRTLTTALAQAFRRAGGRLATDAAVAAVTVSGDRVEGVELDDGERVSAEQVVVAAGVWSPAIGGIPDSARIPIHPVKGQILRLRDPSGPGLVSRALRIGGGYLVPRGDGRYVLGATLEERGFDRAVTAGAVHGLLREAIETVPALDELVLEELSAGLRPATPDNAPAIGPGTVGGLHWATGHYRHGIMLTPITAQLVAAAVAGEQLPDLAAPFAPGRFAELAIGAPR